MDQIRSDFHATNYTKRLLNVIFLLITMSINAGDIRVVISSNFFSFASYIIHVTYRTIRRYCNYIIKLSTKIVKIIVSVVYE